MRAAGRMITVAGEALIDLIVDEQGRVRPSAGGGPFNTARAIARLGQQAAFLGRLSSDRFGRGLASALTGDGVRLLVEARSDEPTTLALLDIDQAGLASYRFYLEGTSAAALPAASLPPLPPPPVTAPPPAVTALPMVLHIGSLALHMEPIGTTIEQLVGSLPDDALLMLDPNCRPPAIKDRPAYLARMARLIRRADIVKTSTEDLAYLSASGPDLLGSAAGHGPGAVVVTDGAEAVHAYPAVGPVISVQVPPVRVADTVGAGDAFGGAFLAWWIGNGLTRADLGDPGRLTAAATAAAEAAAITCTRRGADPAWLGELRGKPGWPVDLPG